MISLSQARMKRMTAIHGWSGVALGVLLYAVVATGAVAVFAPEIGRWSVGTAREAPALGGPIDAIVARLAETVDPAYRDDIGLWSGEGTDIRAFFHTHATNPDTGRLDDLGTIFRVDATSGAVLERRDGFIWREPPAWEASALRRFFVDLHVRLYLPDPWGLILTGILGLMMMAAVISGVLIHRHLLRDLFVAERPGGRLASARNRHALSASWSLPFAFLLAFTGSFFSFASTVGFPLVAKVAFGGDETAMSETLFEPAAQEDPTPVALASVEAIRADSIARAGGAATYIDIARFGRADARVGVWHDPAPGELTYAHHLYDGASGTFLGRRASVGNAPSSGATLYGLMGPLHFGNFAGLLSKAVWGALGVAMCFVILSGLRLWVRRRADQPLWRGFGAAVQVTGYGLPLGMLAAAYAFFLSRQTGDPFWWAPAGFAIGAGIAIGLGVGLRDEERLGRAFQPLLGAICLALPFLRLGTGGMSWSEAVLEGQFDVLSVDFLLLVAGGWLWRFAGAARAIARRSVPGPAE